MSAGLGGNDDSSDGGDSSDESQEVGGDSLSVNPPIRREDKKTIAQRNKEKLKKEKAKKLNEKKKEMSRKKELFRIKAVKKEVRGVLSDWDMKKRKKMELQKQNSKRTKVLSKYKFESPDLEIKLSDELEGTLLKLKPEGNLLNDRFKSLQKRNIIEPRKRAKIVRKYKRKEFEKKSHKAVVS